MNKLVTTLMLSCISLICMAAPPQSKHSVRIGWGDMLFETLVFHESAPHKYDPSKLPDNYANRSTYDYGFTGHIFVDYMYSLNKVTSVGMQTDFEGVFWKEAIMDKYNKPIGAVKNINNFNVTLLPTVRFTFFRRDMIRMYASVGAGALLAFDNQKQFEVVPALNLNFFSVEWGSGPFSGTVELGMLNALAGGNKIYMVGSRLVSVGLKYSW